MPGLDELRGFESIVFEHWWRFDLKNNDFGDATCKVRNNKVFENVLRILVRGHFRELRCL